MGSPEIRGAWIVIDVTVTGVVRDNISFTWSPTAGAVTPVARPLMVVVALSAYDAPPPFVRISTDSSATHWASRTLADRLSREPFRNWLERIDVA